LLLDIKIDVVNSFKCHVMKSGILLLDLLSSHNNLVVSFVRTQTNKFIYV